MSKGMKGIGIIRKLNKALSHYSLITIYKPVLRPHLDYDQPNKESLNQKIERIQFNAALAVTGAIKGTYQSRFYNELGLASLKFRRFFRKLCSFYCVSQYLSNLIPQTNDLYVCAAEDVTSFYSTTNAFKYSFSQYAVFEGNKLDWNIQNSKTMLSFRNFLLKTG